MTAAARPTELPSAKQRAQGFTSARRLICPNGHHMTEDAFVLEHGGLRCRKRDHNTLNPREPTNGARECGAWLYVLACTGYSLASMAEVTHAAQLAPMADTGADPILYVAEVSYHELVEMRRQRLDVNGILEYLGARFPKLAMRSADLPRRRA